MFNLDTITSKNNDKKWSYRMVIIGPSESGKANALVNLIQNDHKVDLYAKDLDEPKNQFLIKKRENAGIKNLNDLSAFIKYSNIMNDAYNHIDDYNPQRK